MRRNNDFILRNIAGESILVPTGELSKDFNGLITLNDMATFIWNHVDECENSEDMLQLVLDAYEVEDNEKAKQDVEGFLDILLQNKMIMK